MVGEYARELLTGIDSSEYIEENWKVQKKKFDINGMYKDPSCPMLYDTTVRAHLAYLLYLGYDGPVKKEIESLLLKSAMITLHTLSATFQFPCGGRSHSYHMNETLLAALCEYYANMYSQKGEKEIAGAFKRTARVAVYSLKRYKGYHLKNFFDRQSGFGCDAYGSYLGYHVTAGCFAMMAYEMYRKKIKEYKSPVECGGYVCRLSEDFHQAFANCGGYSIQVDYQANDEYDANGIVRIHKKGIPGELGLSMGFAQNATYTCKDQRKKVGRAIGPFWYKDKEAVFLSECDFTKKADIHTLHEDHKKVAFEITYYLNEGSIKECYTITKKGVHIVSESSFADISYHVPVLCFNGKDSTTQSFTQKQFVNKMNRYSYKISWKKKVTLTLENEYINNRSGNYKSLLINGNNRKIEIMLSFKERRRKNGKVKKEK